MNEKPAKLIYSKGDVFDAFIGDEVRHFVHGANCFNTMGAGVAGKVRIRLPKLYAADQRTQSGDLSKLGSFSFHNYEGKLAYNLYIQYKFGYDKPYLDYDALKCSLGSMSDHLRAISEDPIERTIGMPMIGSGLSGGVWSDIEAIIREEMNGFTIHVYFM